MSQENVEIVNGAWTASIQGDLNAVLETFDPAVEWDTTTFEGWPETGVYRGHDGVRRFFEEWLASWDDYEAGAEKYIDVDDERVLVFCWQRGVGRDSHAPVHMDWAQLCTLRGGLVRRMAAYSDREAAREAAGLRE